jgi:hypothetical protein
MNAIIQHTFNTGLGDCIVAVSEYIHHAEKLKKLGYRIHLKINTVNNKYYKNLNLFEIFEREEFNIFDSIDHVTASVTQWLDYTTAHISYIETAGQHWWDLFLDTPCNEPVIQFSQNVYGFNAVPEKNVKFNKSIYEMYEKLNLKNYNALYVRNFDNQEYLSLIEDNTLTISNIFNESDRVFVCSNSFLVKQELATNKKTLALSMPSESEPRTCDLFVGSHYNNHAHLSEDIKRERTLITLLEMLILSSAEKVYFLTSWNRISNFLFYTTVNNTPIIFL